MTLLERIDDALCRAETHAMAISMTCDAHTARVIERKAIELANALDAIREMIRQDQL